MTTDSYAGLPVRRGAFQCEDWQRMAENLMAFQDAVQEALGTEEAGDVLGAIQRLRAAAADAERRGYAQAVATLRDDERYRHWWTAQPSDHPCPYWGVTARGHLADYLEVVGADG